MSYEISAPEDGEYLLIKWSGSASAEETKRAGIEGFERATAEGISRVLVDVTDVTEQPSITDQYSATVANSSLGPRQPRCALLGRPDQTNDLSFMETVGRNRGMRIRVFTDKSEALAWLMQT